MPEILNSYVSIAGLVVGTAGLVFTILAWRRASSAEKAATEARDSVRHGNAAEDLRELAEQARELLSGVQQGQAEAALLRCRDLFQGINRARRRWERYFSSPDVPHDLEAAAGKVERVSNVLSVPGFLATPEVVSKLLKLCHEILRILSRESGSMLKGVEGGKHDA